MFFNFFYFKDKEKQTIVKSHSIFYVCKNLNLAFLINREIVFHLFEGSGVKKKTKNAHF